MVRLMRESNKLGMSSCCHSSGGGAAHSAERPVTTHKGARYYPHMYQARERARTYGAIPTDVKPEPEKGCRVQRRGDHDMMPVIRAE